MKRIPGLLLIGCICLLTGCKKEDSSVRIQVKDAVTNTPAKGVRLDLHRCINEPFCGIIAFRTNTTGDDGSCSFTQDEYDQSKQIISSKIDYWGTAGTKNTLLYINPEGWMNLRIIRVTNYPPQSILKITINNLASGHVAFTECNAAADSSIMVRGFGGLTNKVDWRVVDPSFNELNSGTWNQPIPRLNTVNAVLNY